MIHSLAHIFPSFFPNILYSHSTHSLTHSPTHSLTHSLTHSPTHSSIQGRTRFDEFVKALYTGGTVARESPVLQAYLQSVAMKEREKEKRGREEKEGKEGAEENEGNESIEAKGEREIGNLLSRSGILPLPTEKTVFDIFFNGSTKKWIPWEKELLLSNKGGSPGGYSIDPEATFHSVLVPTVRVPFPFFSNQSNTLSHSFYLFTLRCNTCFFLVSPEQTETKCNG